MDYQGLTQKIAEEKLQQFGLNEISEKKPGIFKKLFQWIISPISLMLAAAAILSLVSGRIFDFYFILVLMALNFLISFWQEKKADNAIEKLQQKLSVRAKILRDGKWQEIDSKFIAPGDVIELNLGDIIPADIKILEEKNLSVNEAALTGESLPKDKNPEDQCYSGSFVAVGWARAEVLATGKNTYFGKILISIDRTYRRSLLERDILNISKLLSILSFIAVIILTSYFLFEGKPILELITLDLSLVIAGIPISLPTIMTLIINFGVLGLAKKNTIVRRLSALEDLANVDLLLSDKTGTLTKNEINVDKIVCYSGCTENDVVTWASFTTRENDRNPINTAIIKKKAALKISTDHKVIDFTPFDSDRKRSSALVEFQNEKLLVVDGASQIIEPFCGIDGATRDQFAKDIKEAAQQGYRTVAVAVKKGGSTEEKDMTLAGMLMLSDTLEKGVKNTIKFIKNNGIEIKMLTGDNIAIAERVSGDIGLAGEVANEKILEKKLKDLSEDEFEKVGTFAEILPADKYDLVQVGRKNHVVAVTGDGVNDLPALKTADVGIAVRNAVDALKSAADLALLSSGISVIRDAIIESRKIFARLYTYSVYRISESFRVIVTIALLGLIYGFYPLTPIQLILLALLNDIPIISLAFNRVRIATKPSRINAKSRMISSLSFGTVGIANSFLFFILARNIFHMNMDVVQTLFFLKLTISGHMLIYVAHTRERWWKYLPSSQVIIATFATQILATIFAAVGLFMSKAPIGWIIFIWIWALFWMQVTELTKDLEKKFAPPVPAQLESKQGV